MSSQRDALAVEVTARPCLTSALAQALLTMIRNSDQHTHSDESATIDEARHSDVIAS